MSEGSPVTPASPTRTPLSRNNIDFLLARCSAVVALVLLALGVPDIAVQIPVISPLRDLTFLAGIPATIVACLLIRHSLSWIKASAGTAALLILAGFLVWHLGLVGDASQVESRPWSNGIAPIGVALASVAARPLAAMLYNVSFGAVLALVPAMNSGNTRGWFDAAQDALLCVALGAVIIALMTALRTAASASDDAALRAVATFGDAARAEAIRVERSRLDALIHDSVMATLIVAAQSRAQEIVDAARRAASGALDELDEMMSAREDDTTSISRQEFLNRLTAATARYEPTLTHHTKGPAPLESLPVGASRAVIQATTEAVRNSSLHSRNGPATVTVTFERLNTSTSAEIVVEIRDGGPGFNLSDVSPRRFGVRVSIIQRMRDAHGQAHVVSSPQHGTTVRLSWREGPAGNG